MRETTERIIQELSAEEEFEKEIEKLKSECQVMKVGENELKDTNQKQHEIINVSAFTIDRFKHNQTYFKFYTGFGSYSLFKVVLEYLQPAASKLIYWTSNSNTTNKTDYNVSKRGRSRSLSPEEEFFMILIRLPCGLLIEVMSESKANYVFERT